MSALRSILGRMLGTEDSTPLEFWIAVREGEFLELDDVVALESPLLSGYSAKIFGLAVQVGARHERARLDSDVFLIQAREFPAHVSLAAQVVVR